MKKNHFKKFNNNYAKRTFGEDLDTLIRTVNQYDGFLGNSVVGIGNFLLNFEILNQLYELNENFKKVNNIEETEEDEIDLDKDLEVLSSPIHVQKSSYKRDFEVSEIRRNQLKPDFIGEPETTTTTEITKEENLNPVEVRSINSRKMKPSYVGEEILTTFNGDQKISNINEAESVEELQEPELDTVVEKKTTPKKTIKKKTTPKKK